MFNTKQFRDQATEYRDLGNKTAVPAEARAFQKLEQSFTALADNEQWLADNHDKMVGDAEPVQGGGVTLAAEEEHVLRCLGAAVITQWNTLPTALRRELFDHASAMGDVLQTVELRGQIARFLHKHKDDEV
jgi:rubrerythrin